MLLQISKKLKIRSIIIQLNVHFNLRNKPYKIRRIMNKLKKSIFIIILVNFKINWSNKEAIIALKCLIKTKKHP